MKTLFIHIVFALLLRLHQSECVATGNSEIDKINILDMYLKMENRPTRIGAMLCWDNKDIFKLYKRVKHFSHYSVIEIIDTSFTFQPSRFDNQILFVLDLNCPTASQFLKAGNEKQFFARPFHWLIYGNESLEISADYLTKIFTSLNILVDSDVVVSTWKFNSNTNRTEYLLHQPYKIQSHLPLIVEKYGVWKPPKANIIDLRTSTVISRRRQNLRGAVLTASVVITSNDTLNHLNEFKNIKIDAVSKTNYYFTNFMMDALNVTKKFLFVNTWGYRIPNTTLFTGMVGHLQRKQADVGGTGLLFTPDRIPIIEYIAPIARTNAKFVFRQPPLSYVSNVFTLPFSRSVWLCSGFLVVIIGIALYGTLVWEWGKPQVYENAGIKQRLRAGVGDVVLLSVGAICQQGTPVEPRSGPSRIIVIFLFIFIMVIFTSYSANIIALIQSTSFSILTAEDLLHSRIKLGVQDVVYNHFYFKTHTEPIHREIYMKKVAPPGQKPAFMSLEEGVRRMRDEFFAFHMELGVGYQIVGELFQENQKCGLHEIPYLKILDPWYAVQKRTPYLELFKVLMNRMIELGMKDREFNRFYAKKPQCHGQKSFVSVELIDIYAAFIVLSGGMVLAFVILLVEKMYSTQRKRMFVATTNNEAVN